ncbi:MAG: DUF5012 domain-containing protein [Prevotella sp.]|uniref:BT_2262 family domain-containing protein n=1 Tax=Prevotella sp. TaxID=59823 RepID=UPI002A307BAA|nr:BT_2262 family domain-containing protein [Prevotella sp.]MDD7317838.1 DUF5012 domain-containing protein [Prevotellaceae bacterium]MDY4020753.1 DUF5012 domain-containing protein [Prevotella sp.]
MKKYFLYSLTLCFMMLGFVACSEDEEFTDSRLTYYMKFEMQGPDTLMCPVGTPYVDPGCTATLAGKDVTANIVTEGVEDVDFNKPGLYEVTYSGVGSDGFTSSVTRVVIVYDPAVNEDIAGDYVTVDGTMRIKEGASSEYPGFKVKITKIAPGVFYVDDLLGGYYAQGVYPQYGDLTALKGFVWLHEDMSITGLTGFNAGFKDSFDAVNGSYNKETGELGWTTDYAGMQFVVVLGTK